MDKKREKEEAVRDEEQSKKQKKIDIQLCAELVGAAERGETERVRELLRMEDVDVHHTEGCVFIGFFLFKTAISAACAGGHLETARVILEHEGHAQEELENAFIAAAMGGRLEIVEMLMARGVDPSVNVNVAIGLAATDGHCNVVEFLLSDSRVDPAALDNSAVIGAARNGHCDVLQVLLRDPTVNPAAQNQLAVCWAASGGHVEAVKVLLKDPRVDPAVRNNDPVREAAKRGQLEVLKVMLSDHRVDGTRAILMACARAVRVLLEDERCGVHANRALFEQHHRREVKRYDELVQERTARIAAVSWVMKEIGQGWGDVREPAEARMSVQSVFAGEKLR